MKSIMSRTPHDHSLSFSRRHFDWIISKLGRGEEYSKRYAEVEVEDDEEDQILAVSSLRYSCLYDEEASAKSEEEKKKKKKMFSASSTVKAISRFRSAVSAAIGGTPHRELGLGRHVTGTLYGQRGGHMHFAVQAEPCARPAMLVELAMSTGTLVRKMAAGLVRIALECERGPGSARRTRQRLMEEPLWWAYCNGRKHGRAMRREAGPEDWRVLRAVERVTMGAGVLPAAEGEVMYMRARFERVVGSKDSEALYMISSDNNGGPELTIFFLRV
ncbi:hypothetical protein Cni_G27205 [Canna indica]|uniref:Protein MIZU-KUSSEI 1 n=1 Tax=Canna indica TaxID=4628 RepID=A0AAQ3L193_9LILI|nr:hypothetical protein Cni_G27205 [Canna indica]